MACKGQKKKFFIRVPRPSGWEYVEAVPEQLNLGVITEIYTKDSDSDKSRFMRAHGVEAVVNTGLDISSILAKTAELTEQCAETLKQIGPAGEKVADLLAALQLPDVIQALGAQDAERAEETLQQGLYDFMSKASELAREFADCQANAENACDAMVGVSAVIDRAGLATDDYYTDWAVAVETLNRTVDDMEKIERDLRERRDEIDKARQGWQEVLDAKHPEVAAAVKFLDDQSEGFWIKACQYGGEPEGRAAMEEEIAKAEKKVSVLRGYEALAVDTWERYGKKSFQEVFPLREEIRRLCGELGQAWSMLNEKEVNSPKGAPRPQEAFGELVTDQAYNCAVDRMRDPKWGKLTAESRLFHLIEGIDGLRGDQPRLPAEIREIVDMAEKSIAKIKADWRERERQKTINPPPGPDVTMKLQVGAPLVPTIPQPAVSEPMQPTQGQPPSVETIYELMVCVGYVLTAMKFNTLTCITVMSASKTLNYLGRCSEAETLAAKDAIKRLVMADAETVEDGIPYKDRWKSSKVSWLRYNNGRAWVLKLSEKAGPAARELMAKHNLTEAAIREAFDRMKIDRQQKFNSQDKRR